MPEIVEPPPSTAARPDRATGSHPCPRCSAPVEPGDSFCPACGLPTPGAADAESPERSFGFRCENCGAEVRCEHDSRSTTCPFCAAPYVVEIDPSATGRQTPEFVLGFAHGRDRAEATYRRWIARGGLFRPGDLSRSVQAEGLLGIYLPFWSFSLRADSRWRAMIGEHWYRTETYTVTNSQGKTETRTRQVQETEWWGLEGGHHAYYSFYLVSASKGLPQAMAEWVQPFELMALKRYAAHFLAGWLSEEYSVAIDQARELTEKVTRDRDRQAVAAFLPGDTHRDLEVATDYSEVRSDLILLPIYLRSYRYKGKLYRVLVNGQTGKIAGERPVSPVRVGAAVGLGLVVIGLIVLLIWGLSR